LQVMLGGKALALTAASARGRAACGTSVVAAPTVAGTGHRVRAVRLLGEQRVDGGGQVRIPDGPHHLDDRVPVNHSRYCVGTAADRPPGRAGNHLT